MHFFLNVPFHSLILHVFYASVCTIVDKEALLKCANVFFFNAWFLKNITIEHRHLVTIILFFYKHMTYAKGRNEAQSTAAHLWKKSHNNEQAISFIMLLCQPGTWSGQSTQCLDSPYKGSGNPSWATWFENSWPNVSNRFIWNIHD